MSCLQHRSASAILIVAIAACGCRSDSDGQPSIPVRVPDGTAQNAIQMVGTWEMRNVQVIDTNSTNPTPPINGTPLVIGPEGIRTIGPISFRRVDLEAALGVTFDWYLNSADGRRLFYGISIDRLDEGLGRVVFGMAGGSVDANTMVVEQFNSIQANSSSAESFSRFRYQLVRISNAIVEPEPLPAAEVAAAAQQVLGEIR